MRRMRAPQPTLFFRERAAPLGALAFALRAFPGRGKSKRLPAIFAAFAAWRRAAQSKRAYGVGTWWRMVHRLSFKSARIKRLAFDIAT